MFMYKNKSNHQRKLLLVPIFHTKEDMGSLASRLPTEDGYYSCASYFWKEVKEKVKSYVNGFKKVKVYQDGLPDTDEKLVDKIINQVKSPNYQLLRFLKDTGAKIFGTEAPQLLEEEYRFVCQILQAQDEKRESKIRTSAFGGEPCFSPTLEIREIYENRAAGLLAERDRYIAKRINKTLNKGDLGILFLGAAHQIKDKLPKDIQVEIL